MDRFLTSRQAAEMLQVEHWRVMRLFESGSLSEPQRIGRLRAIPRADLADIADALRDRGWLPSNKKSPGAVNTEANAKSATATPSKAMEPSHAP